MSYVPPREQSRLRPGSSDRLDASLVIRRLRGIGEAEIRGVGAAVFDGVSGPCLGCASTVYTGYTGGVMGIPGDPKDWWDGFSLRNMLEDLCMALDYTEIGACMRDIVKDEHILPTLEDLKKELSGLRCVNPHHKFREELEEVLRNVLKLFYTDGNEKMVNSTGARLAEALIVYMILSISKFKAIPCPGTLVGRVVSGKGDKHIPKELDKIILFNIIEEEADREKAAA